MYRRGFPVLSRGSLARMIDKPIGRAVMFHNLFATQRSFVLASGILLIDQVRCDRPLFLDILVKMMSAA